VLHQSNYTGLAAGLYIHYPFCIKRCPYCGFATAVEREALSARYREVLLYELEQRLVAGRDMGFKVATIYFGGGTPSLMPPEFVAELLNSVRPFQTADSSGIEITLEANPETRDIGRFAAFHMAGVNRLSMGAQSFDNRELKALGRAHDASGVVKAVEIARNAGFDNLSLDLIYGLPGSTVETFQYSVEAALALGIDHLSTYTLSIEEGTPFARSVRERRMPFPDPDLMATQYAMLCAAMADAGFEHYELTNFARPAKWSRHNYTYWQRRPYLGVGCGAHMFEGERRRWNQRDTTAHIEAVERWRESGMDPVEGEEVVTPKMALEESVYLGLRTARGIDDKFARSHFDPAGLDEMLTEGFLEERDGRIAVRETKWLLLDEIVLRVLKSI